MFLADAPSGGCGNAFVPFLSFPFLFLLKSKTDHLSRQALAKRRFLTKGVSSVGSGLGSAHHERPIGKIISDTDIIDTFSQHVGNTAFF